MIIPEECAITIQALKEIKNTNVSDWDKFYKFFIPQYLSHSVTKKVFQNAPLRYQYLCRIIQAKKQKRINATIKAVIEIVQSAIRQNINFVIIKGLAFSAFLYDDLYDRYLSDIDTLVNDKDMAQMDTLLRSLGYHQFADLDDGTRIELPFPILKAAGHHEYFEYTKEIDDEMITVEVCRWLHVNILDRTEEFLSKKVNRSFQGLTIPTLNDNDCALNLLENAYHNSFGIRSNLFAISRLKDIEDVHRAILFLQTINHNTLVDWRHRYPFIQEIISLAEELFYAKMSQQKNIWELSCSASCSLYLNKILYIDKVSLQYRKNMLKQFISEAETTSKLVLYADSSAKRVFTLEISADSLFILQGIQNLPEDERIRLRILWNEQSFDYIYIFIDKGRLCLSIIHDTSNFFDDYNDLSTQIMNNRKEVFLTDGMLYLTKGLLKPPPDFMVGVIKMAVQQRVFNCIYHTVAETNEQKINRLIC